MLQVIKPAERWFQTPWLDQLSDYIHMSLKRKAGELGECSGLDALHPAKRAAGPVVQTRPEHTQDCSMMAIDSCVSSANTDMPVAELAGHETSAATATAAGAAAAAAAAAAIKLSTAAPSQTELHPQQPPALSTCTDIVLYKAPAAVVDLGAAGHGLLHPELPVLQQQPNALAMLWRSLTPVQRRSLAGMWDALRDEKMVAGMLKKLPPQQQPAAEGQQCQAAGSSSPTCIVEELDDIEHASAQHSMHDAKAAALHNQLGPAAGGASRLTAATNNVMHATQFSCGNPSGSDAMVLDQGQQVTWRQQQEMQQAQVGSGPMDMEL